MKKLIYTPSWYEMDQPLILGKKDKFYISKDKKSFSNEFASYDDVEIEGIITKIYHPEPGEFKELNTKGLVYRFYKIDGSLIKVEAEETPWHIEYPPGHKDITNWDFEVELSDYIETGYSSKKRLEEKSNK